jgi:uncharacterized FAD-dependent dehydrogenase
MKKNDFREFEVRIPAEAFAQEDTLRTSVLLAASIPDILENKITVLRKSIDARGRQIFFNLKVAIGPGAEKATELNFRKGELPFVGNALPVLVAGSGPAGIFAAMELIQLGFKPIIIERGKDVRARRRDLADLNKANKVNPDSNYCFGEGGAGTYSDGKLYTRSNKRGDIRRVLEIMVAHGANPDILVEAHPHIGTNKLPPLVAALRETILEHGGEIHFDSRITDIVLKGGKIHSVQTADGKSLEGKALILATGHSARDIFELLHRKEILIEAKPFALGFRVEHPQALIDQIQYKGRSRGEFLPAASYSLVHQSNTRQGIKPFFSFCMCPGGFIVPSMTAEGEMVINGMSPSRRNSRFANSGMVVAVGEEEFAPFKKQGPLAGMQFQASLERAAAALLPGKLAAPAQRLTDFLKGRVSSDFPDCSYQPGLVPAQLSELVPSHFAEAMKTGFQAFGKKMPGYITEEAVLVGLESRTSSPVRVPRDKESARHPEISNLFPCGEGGGYAGGIMSAALDGIFVARCLASSLS